MRKEDFFEVLVELDDDIVEEAKSTIKKKSYWKVWGTTAACLCLAVGVLAFAHLSGQPHAPVEDGSPGGTVAPGSGDSGGINIGIGNGMYSVAVFPPTESEQNVAAADVTSLSENEMIQLTLAEHLPTALPNGFHYGRGSHYETTMKDGTQYHMLRIEYITGTIPEQQFADGGTIAPDPEAIGDEFLLMLRDHAPKKDELYTPEDVTPPLLEDGNTIWIQYGEFYVGVSAVTAEAEAVLEAIRSID